MQRSTTDGVRGFRYFDIVVAFYITSLFTSNFIAAGKIATIGGFEFGAGILVFPFGYIFADILTEVYGYAAARRCVWIGFAVQAVATLIAWMVVSFPPAPAWDSEWVPGYSQQKAWSIVFGASYRIVFASFIAFWAGDLANSYVLSKMKIMTRGKWLWTRTIGSTIVGQAVDSAIFYPLGLMAIPVLGWTTGMSFREAMFIALVQFALKVSVEVIATPLTYLIVGWLKRKEQYDAYDVGIDYSPFHVRMEYGTPGDRPSSPPTSS